MNTDISSSSIDVFLELLDDGVVLEEARAVFRSPFPQYEALTPRLQRMVDARVASINPYDSKAVDLFFQPVGTLAQSAAKLWGHVSEQERKRDRQGMTIAGESWQKHQHKRVRAAERRAKLTKKESAREKLKTEFQRLDAVLAWRDGLYEDLYTARLAVLCEAGLRIIAARMFIDQVESGAYQPRGRMRLRPDIDQGRAYDNRKERPVHIRSWPKKKKEPLLTLKGRRMLEGAFTLSANGWRLLRQAAIFSREKNIATTLGAYTLSSLTRAYTDALRGVESMDSLRSEIAGVRAHFDVKYHPAMGKTGNVP